MDDVFVKAFEAWDGRTQAAFLAGMGAMACLASVLALWTLCRTLRLMWLGYPPLRPVQPLRMARQGCDHSDSLTNECLKPGGCKTISECGETLRLHNLGCPGAPPSKGE